MPRYVREVIRGFGGLGIWMGFEIEEWDGDVDQILGGNYLRVDHLRPEEIEASYGVTEFDRVSPLELDDFFGD